MKWPVVAGAPLLVVASLIGGLCLIGTTSAPAVADSVDECVTTGPVPGLSAAAAHNARTVASVARRRGGRAGELVALLAAYTESGLLVLGNPNAMPPGVVPAGAGGSPIEGLGYDHDSLGLFQQRASWGTAAQRLDPVTSTEMFMAAVLKVHAWASRDPWTVAQDVQVSAWDGKPRAANNFNSVYGGNYLANLDRAKRMVDRIDRDQSTATCGTLSGGLAASTEPGSQGLPPAYRIPAEATPAEARVVSYAIAQLDKPYVFGAAGPNAFDCSGLTMAAWRQGGAQLVHSTTAQAQEGTPTTPSGLMPGDLVLVPGDDGTLAAPGHVGLYIGSGLVLNAADEQIGIRVQTYDNFVAAGHGLSALRHIK